MKKHYQLGMNPSTASNRLIKDLLWDFVVKTGKCLCFKCGKEMTRETFSVEHILPWLDSADPVGLYFDIANISYSHRVCNISAARKPNKLNLSKNERGAINQRNSWNRLTKDEQKAKRREKYLKYDC